MFIGRIDKKHLLLLIGSGIVGIFFLIILIFNFPNAIPRGTTWKARIESFSSGETKANYQSEQAKIAIATGGIIGKGPGNSIQRNFLPQASSDFIFAILIEEWGFVTAIIIIFLYLILLYRGVQISSKSNKHFGMLLSIGLTFNLVFQAMINMAVAVNLLPVTGQSLPLISMGGTSIWFTSIAIGVILSISTEKFKPKESELEGT
jgi:cell division protein FtsW